LTESWGRVYFNYKAGFTWKKAFTCDVERKGGTYAKANKEGKEEEICAALFERFEYSAGKKCGGDSYLYLR
jgi:hypothetical protein